jgi:hypothetical protein
MTSHLRAIYPLLVATALATGCTSPDSTEWWIVSREDLVCLKARFALGGIESPTQFTERQKGCVEEPSADGTAVNVDCSSGELKANFIFARSEGECTTWLEKLRPVLEKQNEAQRGAAALKKSN